ncbi:putative serine/threonine-protein kinase receptor [Vitis vinifera]|uniref:Putative serine/threonine-protein kinase receptor n=1 Tax=Vitis vinifera TaxID=29760 RepID=A0A438DP57_VITVI|nr:putative serine/threonine-protein kinase receptor [Vitis vinifera]
MVRPSLQLVGALNWVSSVQGSRKLPMAEFDYPCDTLLPGMKLGWNRVAGLDRYLSSWKSADDPSKGNLLIGLILVDFHNYFEEWFSCSISPGPWNGIDSVEFLN